MPHPLGFTALARFALDVAEHASPSDREFIAAAYSGERSIDLMECDAAMLEREDQIAREIRRRAVKTAANRVKSRPDYSKCPYAETDPRYGEWCSRAYNIWYDRAVGSGEVTAEEARNILTGKA
jgi:hypothetical protein